MAPKGMAATQTFDGKPGSTYEPMEFYCLYSICRAGGAEPAMSPRSRHQLIDPDKPNQGLLAEGLLVCHGGLEGDGEWLT